MTASPTGRDFGKHFLLISLILGVSVLFCLLLVHEGDRIARTGLSLPIICGAWALIALIPVWILFVVLGSKAEVSYAHRSWVVRLRGPAAMYFLLVAPVWYQFLINIRTSFTVTVRPYAEDGSQSLVTSGSLVLRAGQFHDTVALGPQGEAIITGVPIEFRTSKVTVIPTIDGFVEKPHEVKADKDGVIDLPLEKIHYTLALAGQVVPPPPEFRGATVEVEGRGKGSIDRTGAFNFVVAGREGDWVRFVVSIDGKERFSESRPLAKSVVLSMSAKP